MSSMIKKGEILKVHRNSQKLVSVVEIGFPYHDELKSNYKEDMIKFHYGDLKNSVGHQTWYTNLGFTNYFGPLHAQAIDMNFKFNQERIEGLVFNPMLYVQKENDGTNFPHNHTLGGSSISSTFYIDPPESGGEIQFYFGPNDTATIKTKPNVLYAFPSWLYHAPLLHSGTETRVCVNVDYFTLGRAVFTHEQKWGRTNIPERRPATQGWDNRPYSIW